MRAPKSPNIELTASVSAADDFSGGSVVLDGSLPVFGALFRLVGTGVHGAAYLYDLSLSWTRIADNSCIRLPAVGA